MGRTDRWDAELTEQQRWAIYENSLRFNYPVLVEWLQKEYTLSEVPSKTAFYNWKSAMRRDEANYRREQLVQARLEIGKLAEVRTAPAEMAAALQSLGAEAALSGNLEDAKKLVTMAAQIADGQRQGRKLELQEKELKLAQDKFAAAEARLNAVRDAIATAKTGSGGLTPEALKQIEEAAGLL